MEVINSNFAAVLKQFRVLVRRCDFLAIDLEFTGLHTSKANAVSSADNLQIRYLKIRDSAKHFAVLQLGVSLFTWVPKAKLGRQRVESTSSTDSEEGNDMGSTLLMSDVQTCSRGSWEIQPFNIYVFPSGASKTQHSFVFETSSLKFLAQHNFDFNKCVSEGVHYLSRADTEAQYKFQKNALLKSLGGNRGSRLDTTKLRVDDEEFVHAQMIKVRELHSSARDVNSNSEVNLGPLFTSLAPCNSYRRRVLYQMIEDEFGDVMIVEKESKSQQRGMASLRVTLFPSAEAKQAHDLEKRASKLQMLDSQFDSAAGVRHIFDAISDSQKPVIGHNCFLDLAHIFEKFHSPLPLRVEEFTKTVHEKFPCIVDTKLLLSANKELNRLIHGQTSLGNAFAMLNSEHGDPDTPVSAHSSSTLLQPSLTKRESSLQSQTPILYSFAEGFKTYAKSNARHHEAAYDAFMTGVVFLNAAKSLGMNPQDISSWSHSFTGNNTEANGQTSNLSSAEDNLYRLTNQLYLMRLDESLHLPETGTGPDRSLFVHISGHPHKAQTGDFYRAFRNAQGGVRRVHWVDDNNLFLEMNESQGVKDAISRSFVKPSNQLINEEYDPLASLEHTSEANYSNHALGNLHDLEVQSYDKFQGDQMRPLVESSRNAVDWHKRSRSENTIVNPTNVNEGADDTIQPDKKKRKISSAHNSNVDHGVQDSVGYCTIS